MLSPYCYLLCYAHSVICYAMIIMLRCDHGVICYVIDHSVICYVMTVVLDIWSSLL